MKNKLRGILGLLGLQSTNGKSYENVDAVNVLKNAEIIIKPQARTDWKLNCNVSVYVINCLVNIIESTFIIGVKVN